MRSIRFVSNVRSVMKTVSVIQNPVELRDLLAHLVKMGRALPGFDPSLPN